MQQHLREHVLRLVHVVIYTTLLLRDWCNCTFRVVHKTTASIAHRLGLVTQSHTEQREALRGKQPRPPRAVAVVLADSCTSVEPLDQLAAVLAWCVLRDVRTLLVYHPQGMGVGQLHQLSVLMSSSVPDVAIQAGFGGARSNCQHDCKCAGRSSRAHVHLLDAKDACWPLVQAARTADQQPCDGLDSCLHPAAALHSQVVGAAGEAAAAEPDIVLVFGQAFTLAGFPPWLLRFGELYHLGHLSDVTDELLRTALKKYSNVAQRFGT